MKRLDYEARWYRRTLATPGLPAVEAAFWQERLDDTEARIAHRRRVDS